MCLALAVLVRCRSARHGARLTFAATSTLSTPARDRSRRRAAELPPLVVPDVRQQAYVFAKGTLEQGGFAWRVEGGVRGYSANVVASQSPAPGSKVVADGAPTIVLRLQRNAGYAQEGTPENSLPYAGVPARRFGVGASRKAKAKAQGEDGRRAGDEAEGDRRPLRRGEAGEARPRRRSRAAARARPPSSSPARPPSRSTR